MSLRLQESGGAFRRSVRLVSGSLQVTAAGLVALYLTAMLQLDGEQWREFWIGIGVFTVAYTVLNETIQRRIEGPVSRRLEEERQGKARGEDLAAAFKALLDVPYRMFLLATLSWNLAGLAIPLWMHLRTGDLSLFAAVVIWASAITGGFVSCIFVFLALKRHTEPLREAWAAQLGDPHLRATLVRRLPLAVKLGAACCAVVGVSVLFSVLMAYGQAVRPLELHATQIQQRHLQRLAAAMDRPGEGPVEHGRRELRDLGVASELMLFDAATGRVEEGQEGWLSPSEVRLLVRSGGMAGDSGSLDSSNVFAWVPLEGRPDVLLVAITPARELTARLSGVRVAFALLLAATLGITAVSAVLLAADVSRATRRLREHVERIASGDLRSPLALESEDELGDLARSFEAMTHVLRATVARVGAAADGVDAAASAIADSSSVVVSATTDQTQGVEQATVSMASIDRQVAGIAESAHLLTGNVEEAGSSILELGAASEELHQTASALSAQVEDVGGSIEQMIRSVRHVAENTEGLAHEAGETSASISEMARSLREVDVNAHETARLSHRVVELAEAGRARVQQTIAGMDAIRESTDTVAAVIQGLGGRVGEIGAIVDVIDDVADETNLLALNAAIIAAQAGEQGRAFSVVADEIKDLADRVLSSTKEIAGLIRAVQEESANATTSIERGTTSVQTGVALSAEAGKSLEDITEAARASGERIGEIVSAVREQARASSQVAGLMERVNRRVEEIRGAVREQERGNEIVMRSSLVVRDVAQQTRRTTEEQSRGAQRIRESMESVRDAVDRIHLALKEQSHACRQAVSFLEKIFERTRSNGEAAQRTTEASRALKGQAQALRDDVRRFRI